MTAATRKHRKAESHGLEHGDRVTLRLLDSIDSTALTGDLPVMFDGNYRGANRYAAKHGYVFRRSAMNLWGGYFAHPETGACLLPWWP